MQFQRVASVLVVCGMTSCLAGCSAKTASSNEGRPSTPPPGGVRGEDSAPSRTVKLQAVIVTKGQQVIKLALMDVSGAPLESVRAALATVLAEREKSAQQLRRELAALSGDVAKASERVRAATSAWEAAREAARESYDKERPADVARSADRSSRSELDDLLSKRKQQRIVDQRFEDAMSSTGSLQQAVQAAQSELDALQRRQSELQSQAATILDIDPIEYLFAPAKTWKTDVDGVVPVSLPDQRQWVLWASNTREVGGPGRSSMEYYRWIVLAPEAADSTETLYLDNSNLFKGGLPPYLTPP